MLSAHSPCDAHCGFVKTLTGTMSCFLSFFIKCYDYFCRKGDYHRYLAEFATGNERKEAAENSLVAYKAASDEAASDLATTHPIRLGLALNFSVFYYEILNAPERYFKLAYSRP